MCLTMTIIMNYFTQMSHLKHRRTSYVNLNETKLTVCSFITP